MFLNYADESVEELCRLIDHPVPPVAPLDRVRENDTLQFVPFLKDGEEGFLKAALKNVEMTRSVPYCFDVLPAGGGKDVGMGAVLRRAGIAPEETMAFGDGLDVYKRQGERFGRSGGWSPESVAGPLAAAKPSRHGG